VCISHSVTYYLTPMNMPHLNPSQTDQYQYTIYLPPRDGRLSWLRWLVTYGDGLLVYRLTHPSSNHIIVFCLWICTESCGKAEPGTMSVRVKPGNLSLGEPGCWSSHWSSSTAAHVATFHAALPRPQHHQTWVRPTVQISTLTCITTAFDFYLMSQSLCSYSAIRWVSQ